MYKWPVQLIIVLRPIPSPVALKTFAQLNLARKPQKGDMTRECPASISTLSGFDQRGKVVHGRIQTSQSDDSSAHFGVMSVLMDRESRFLKVVLPLFSQLQVLQKSACPWGWSGKCVHLFYSRHRRVLERWKKQLVLECPPVVTTLSHFGPLKQGGAGWGPNCWKKRLQRAFLLFRKSNWQVRLKPKM